MNNSIIQSLHNKSLISPPKWLSNNIQYEVITGSHAYGIAQADSDYDVYGFCIPTKDIVFPHLAGEIPGFGKQIKRFEQYQEHHILDGLYGYDLSIYSIVKYFQLCMDNNPNMIDTLFVPGDCILFISGIGKMVRNHRRLFLHKGSYFKFKGYAHSQLSKMKNKSLTSVSVLKKFEEDNNIPHHISLAQAQHELKVRQNNLPRLMKWCPDAYKDTSPNMVHVTMRKLKEYVGLYESIVKFSTRAERIKIDGFDRKHACHLIRLLCEAEQILNGHNLDLRKNIKLLSEVRNGNITEEEIIKWAKSKGKELDKLYENSTLRDRADEVAIKQLLLDCLEEHYGCISNCVKK